MVRTQITEDFTITRSGTDLLEARSVSYSYGRARALDSLSMQLQQGVVGILGPNGAGKSTFLHILAGAESADTGTVLWKGQSLAQDHVRKQYARNLGFLPQEFGFVPGFTVRDTVEYVAWMRGTGDAGASVGQALKAVGMEKLGKRRLSALSGGQRRRVGIAQAIVNRPRVLLLDEPTAGLDPAQRSSFRRLLQNLAKNSLIVISTHLVEDVASVCTEVRIMEAGTLRFEGTPDELAIMGTSEQEGASPLERGYHSVLGGQRW